MIYAPVLVFKIVWFAMTTPTILTEIISWIESHENSVDLLKWFALGIFAWIIGVFRFIKAKFKRPKLEIESFTSRCAWEELGVLDGHDHNARIVFLIEAGINNPTTDPIVIRDFTLQIKRLKKWPIWHQSLHPITLPSRVRQEIGATTKLFKNWFSQFSEGSESLTLEAKIEPREFHSGFLLFVSVSYGYMRPLTVNGHIPVRLRVRLTTGETLIANSSIMLLSDNTVLERMVPGLISHVQNRETWNAIRQKS